MASKKTSLIYFIFPIKAASLLRLGEIVPIYFSLSPVIFPSSQCRHRAICQSQIIAFNRLEEGLCVSASLKVLMKGKVR